MSKVGALKYENEIFLGKEELARKQQMERNSVISLIRRFGEKGLFDLKREKVGLLYNTDPSGDTVFEFFCNGDEDCILLGFDGENPIYIGRDRSKFSLKVDSGTKVYVGLRALTESYEYGTITIGTSGLVEGIDTEFTKLLRSGQSNRKSRIKVNGQIYTVESVESDTRLYLSGSSFPAVSNAKYSVLPTVSSFFNGTDEDLYKYDYCELVVSTSEFDEEKTFQIAAFTKSSSSSTLEFDQKTLLRNFGSDSIDESDIKDGSITNNKIKDGEIGSEKLKDSIIGRKKLSNNLGDLRYGFWDFFGIFFYYLEGLTRTELGVGGPDVTTPFEKTPLFTSFVRDTSGSYNSVKKSFKITVNLRPGFEFASYSSAQVSLGSGWNLKQVDPSGEDTSLGVPSLVYKISHDDSFKLTKLEIVILNIDLETTVTREVGSSQVYVAAFLKRTDDLDIDKQ